MDEPTSELDLPGFRFHPTEEELLDFYLRNMVYGKMFHLDVIGCVNIYRHDPWDLPGLAKIGEREWYFFVPRDRKHGTEGRPNRTTENGFWKATGSDRRILSLSDSKRIIGLRKTLVFYKGRSPKGIRTDWVMNEYRLPDSRPLPKDIVLCKIFRKATSLKELEQRAAMEEETTTTKSRASPSSSPPSSSLENIYFCHHHEEPVVPMPMQYVLFKKEVEENNRDEKQKEMTRGPSLQLSMDKDMLPELQMPKLQLDNWNDPFLLYSPCLQNLTPSSSYCELLKNF
ncbi:hypothetical protein K2173_012501 [Erythroxylum novogranatense]|uniref:NAC domain-containing protein n=1 Tax=Erythroxylum novogranatense TaxID=1862640 RepID=A0AAV8TJB0_9ROSI|nr:hypothetical protein K2173_012501 [Erythroxylum novogranatense]